MKISARGEYGLRAILDLAEMADNEPLSINFIASKENISPYYLEHILGDLKNGSLIKSVRGSKGGYILTRPPDKISIGEVLRCVEGPIEIADCTDGIRCSREKICPLRLIWKKLKSEIEDILYSTTLLDILDKKEKEAI